MELDAKLMDSAANTEAVWNEIATAYQKNSFVKARGRQFPLSPTLLPSPPSPSAPTRIQIPNPPPSQNKSPPGRAAS